MMKLITVTFVFILLSTATNGKLTVLRYEKCDPTVETPIDINIKLKDVDDYQMIEQGSLKTSVPIGNNLDLLAEGYNYENGKYVFFISFRKDFCETVDQYAREFVNDLERAAGIDPVGQCPLPEGEYSLENYKLDYGLLKKSGGVELDGQIKIVINLMDKATNTSLSCVEIEAKNEVVEEA